MGKAHPLLLAPVPLKTLPSLAGSSSPETDPILCECLVVTAHQNSVDLRIAKSDWQSLRLTWRTRNSGWSR